MPNWTTILLVTFLACFNYAIAEDKKTDEDAKREARSTKEEKDKRALLDRIDSNHQWGFYPKYASYAKRDMQKRLLDRIDQPSGWGVGFAPKYADWKRSRQEKRLLDRIDQPNGWGAFAPKYSSNGWKRESNKQKRPLDRIDQPDRWNMGFAPKYSTWKRAQESETTKDKRLLDRIDGPDPWGFGPRY